jgi:Holliday junction resolvase RusA-like endonuclease
MIEIIIPGEPIAKHRPKFTTRGKFPRAYNDQETEEGKFIAQVLHQIDGLKIFDKPLTVDLYFFRSRPKSHYGTGRNANKIKPSAPTWPTTKPDVDNYIKFTLDCLNDILWKDDALVVRTNAVKSYAEDPRTIIQVREA